jgi:hypothetical protein
MHDIPNKAGSVGEIVDAGNGMASKNRLKDQGPSLGRIIRLEQWIRAGSTPQQVVLRARIMVAAAQGQTDLRITGDLKVQRRTVALWRQRV